MAESRAETPRRRDVAAPWPKVRLGEICESISDGDHLPPPKSEELRKEQARTTEMGLAEEELEIYDLLIQGRKLTKAEEQKVILASKNLYKKLVEARKDILVVDWYKDEQPREKVRAVIQEALNADLPESYDKPVFDAKTNLLLSHFVDMAVQGYGWISAA